MDRCSGNLHPGAQRLQVRLDSGKGRQQRRMDVDHAAVPALYECWRKQTHESRKTNQLDPVLLQRRLQYRLERRAIVTETLAVDRKRRDMACARFFEPAGIRPVRNDQHNLGREVRCRSGPDQCGHVRSTP